jgi:TonB family protein
MQLSTAVLSFLASVALRSLVLFAVAALALVRMKSAAGRHAAWTAVLLGMLLLPLLEPALPSLPVRVLKPVAPITLSDLPVDAGAGARPAIRAGHGPAPQAARFTWSEAAAVVYALVALILLARIAVSWLFTRRLLRAAQPVEGDLYESSWISVPMTLGRKILLPADWRDWDAAKLDAVLAHERTHVRRADWAIALAAGVNRSVFWFHPLAWWLERHLAALAEHACDDAALLEVSPAPYAQALLDMASAVKTAQGRLMWEAMAMAQTAEVQKRIERALDETREIPRPFTARRWLALAACAVPVLWIAAVAQLAPVAAQEQGTPSAAEAAAEGYVAAHPDDLQARVNLILSYYAHNVREPRLAHIYWLIANHPEASQTLFASRGITARDSVFNVRADFDRAAGLWRQAVATHADDQRVVRNTSEFFTNAGQYPEAEQVLQDARRLHSEVFLDSQLGRLYANAILGATGDPKFPNSNPTFAAHAQSALEASDNRNLVVNAAMILASVARRPQPGQTLPENVLNLDEHSLLVPAVELGHRLLEREGMRFDEIRAPIMVGQRKGNAAPSGGVTGGVAGGTGGGVLGGIVGSAPAPNAEPRGVLGGIVASVPAGGLPPAPPVVSKVDPVYPPLARQARISGIVNMKTTIAADGSVQHIEVVSGHPLLVAASIDALKNWKFAPNAAGTYRVDIPFVLATEDAGGKSITLSVGGAGQSAKLINHVDPVYPAAARAAGIEGTVTVFVTIAEDGTVETAEPVDGSPALAAAAINAVKQWTWHPTLLNGRPVKVTTNVTVPFKL